MNYFSLRGYLRLVKSFKEKVTDYWLLEHQLSDSGSFELSSSGLMPRGFMRVEPDEDAKKAYNRYKLIREKIAKDVNEVTSIAETMEVPSNLISYPAPAFGGVVTEQSLFHAILFDTSHGRVPRLVIMDAINQVIGRCEHEGKKSLKRMINPLYWPFFLLKIVLRIPFILLRSAGFNIETLESHLAARLVKTVLALLIILLLIYLGVENEIITRLFAGLLH